MSPPLPSNQLKKTVSSAIKMHDGDELRWHYNSDRRILFNPIHKLSRKEKMEIVNKEMGRLKVNGSKQKIYDAIETWDFSSYGKITQKGIAKSCGLSIATVKRYWSPFKSIIAELNLY